MCAICCAPSTMRVYLDDARVSICDTCHFETVELATSCRLPKFYETPRVAPPDPVMVEIARELSALVRG